MQSFPWDKQDLTLYEGDIKHFGDKNAILSNSYRWSNAKIPYEISNAYSKSIFLILSNLVGHRLIMKMYFSWKSSRSANSYRICYERIPQIYVHPISSSELAKQIIKEFFKVELGMKIQLHNNDFLPKSLLCN